MSSSAGPFYVWLLGCLEQYSRASPPLSLSLTVAFYFHFHLTYDSWTNIVSYGFFAPSSYKVSLTSLSWDSFGLFFNEKKLFLFCRASFVFRCRVFGALARAKKHRALRLWGTIEIHKLCLTLESERAAIVYGTLMVFYASSFVRSSLRRATYWKQFMNNLLTHLPCESFSWKRFLRETTPNERPEWPLPVNWSRQ